LMGLVTMILEKDVMRACVHDGMFSILVGYGLRSANYAMNPQSRSSEKHSIINEIIRLLTMTP
jgi:hypothetical protein